VMAAAATVQPDDRLLVVLPLFHANAQYYSFAAAISAGASVALMPGFSASRFLQQAARHRATHASLFAAPIRMILARGATPVPGLRLRHVWYAQNVTDAQYEDFAALVGCRPRQLYGMTETLPAVLSQRALDPEPGFLGEATVGCDVELDEAGEITVGGRRGHELFAGYLEDPQSTEAAFRDGRFRTGDLARRDARGRLSFAGRGSDVLKVAGENVSTVEVEAVLAQHPAVHEVAVVGEPDAVRDEVPVAYVVGVPGAVVVADTLLAWAAERLAPAKRPRAVHVVDALPRTSVGKIRKFLLRGPAGQPAEASSSPAGGGPGS
jgi:carnitine-CoA ligase